ncbi:GntR family transcriptional regulator [Micromonospora inyonensis]|uniref:Transcriptional regulator, GntR family n=1 Tax=Micromonospora inyonensis TaxID=47866 RepID=A0A1C6SHN3_9ACTN|nr:GntR family transcriptional regulator [Micromonospora inyonensis]SCL28967.1 transcriptional regulator, GntR family [Micromonospora inyonensis]
MDTNWSVRLDTETRTLGARTAARLRELIRDGVLAPGTRLPAEPELARRLGVSRPTLRAAVTELIGDLLLVRRRGVGTFVSAAPRPAHGLERLTGTGRGITLVGRRPGTTGLRVRHVVADPALAAHLHVDPGSPVVHLTRTRTADGVPVAHCAEWIPAGLLPEPTALDAFGAEDSLHDRLAALGLPLRQAVARLVPVTPDADLRDRLHLASDAPLLLLEQRHFAVDPGDRVALFSRHWYDTDRIDLELVRRG